MLIETTVIQRFMDMVKRAAQARARDLRIDLSDATALAAEIGGVLGRLAALESGTTSAGPSSMDGGGLR